MDTCQRQAHTQRPPLLDLRTFDLLLNRSPNPTTSLQYSSPWSWVISSSYAVPPLALHADAKPVITLLKHTDGVSGRKKDRSLMPSLPSLPVIMILYTNILLPQGYA